MAEVKLVVIYPRPTDVQRFEKLFLENHIPMAVKNLADQTKIVATKVTECFGGMQSVHRITEIYFPSLEALNACAASRVGQETIAHAESISTGGKPIFLVAEEEVITFNNSRLMPKKRPRSARLSFLNGAEKS
jgi:uncharacterized protein (TIGR02118 family)